MTKQLPNEVIHPHLNAAYDDEIDLYELWLTVVANKFTLLLVMLATLFIGGVYAYLTPPTYEIETSFIPPSRSDVAILDRTELNLLQKEDNGTIKLTDMSLDNTTSEYVYDLFKRTLYSDQVQQMILQSYNNDRSLFKFIVGEKKQTRGKTNIRAITLKLTTNDKKKGVEVLKKIIIKAKERAQQQLLDDLELSIHQRITQYELLIETYLKTESNTSLYIHELVKLKSELTLLQQPIDKTSLVVTRVDQVLQEPLHPVKPKKSLVLVVSAILGLMLGLAFVFFRQFFTNAKEKYDNEAK